MIILGLDFGTVRIGVAKSDPMGIIAQGLAVIEEKNQEDVVAVINHIIEVENVDKVIVGLPKNMDGSMSKIAEDVQAWVNYLNDNLAVSVETWDERLTSKEAERFLLEGDLSRKQRKRRIDKLSAQIMLQSYLDAHSGRTENLDNA